MASLSDATPWAHMSGNVCALCALCVFSQPTKHNMYVFLCGEITQMYIVANGRWRVNAGVVVGIYLLFNLDTDKHPHGTHFCIC